MYKQITQITPMIRKVTRLKKRLSRNLNKKMAMIMKRRNFNNFMRNPPNKLV